MAVTNCSGQIQTSSLQRLLDTLRHQIEQGLAARRARMELARLDEAILHDLGLTRADIEQAVAGPWWQPIDFRSLEEKRRRRGDFRRKVG